MITRYALFEGSIAKGKSADFRKAILEELVPTWQVFPGVTAIRVSFVEERDPGAPEVVLILAVDYPDRATLDTALASDARRISKATTERVVPQYFSGRIYHQVTEMQAFQPL